MEIIALNERIVPIYDLKGGLSLLFRFKTTEIYSRYNGIGVNNIFIDFLENVEVETINGNSIEVNLSEMTVLKKIKLNSYYGCIRRPNSIISIQLYPGKLGTE